MEHRELGEEMLQRIAGDLEEHASVDSLPKFEGRQLSMVLSPKKRSKKDQPKQEDLPKSQKSA